MSLTGSTVLICVLTTLQLFKYISGTFAPVALFGFPSGASEMISLCLDPVKRFFYEFLDFAKICYFECLLLCLDYPGNDP